MSIVTDIVHAVHAVLANLHILGCQHPEGPDGENISHRVILDHDSYPIGDIEVCLTCGARRVVYRQWYSAAVGERLTSPWTTNPVIVRDHFAGPPANPPADAPAGRE